MQCTFSQCAGQLQCTYRVGFNYLNEFEGYTQCTYRYTAARAGYLQCKRGYLQCKVCVIHLLHCRYTATNALQDNVTDGPESARQSDAQT